MLHNLDAIQQTANACASQAATALRALPKGLLLNAVQAGALLHVISYVGMQKAGVDTTTLNQLGATVVVTAITSTASYLLRANAVLTGVIALVTFTTGVVTHKMLHALCTAPLQTNLHEAHQTVKNQSTQIQNLQAELENIIRTVSTTDEQMTLEELVQWLKKRVQILLNQVACNNSENLAIREIISKAFGETVSEKEPLRTLVSSLIKTNTMSLEKLRAELETANQTIAALRTELQTLKDAPADQTEALAKAQAAELTAKVNGASASAQAPSDKEKALIELLERLTKFASDNPNYDKPNAAGSGKTRQNLATEVCKIIKELKALTAPAGAKAAATE